MNIFITGGLGFVGRNLSTFLLQNGHRVTAVGVRKDPELIDHSDFRYISADTTQTGAWQQDLADQQVIVNLAGKSIFKRWTEKYKKQIMDSRILTTRNLVNALPSGSQIIFCSTSAVGYYGSRGDETLVEETPPGDDFLAEVGKNWEQEALQAQAKGIRVVLTRFGIVLDRGGGAMAKMIPAFRFFMGGPQGNGKQWFPWIHMHDLLSAYQFVIENSGVYGPVNFCAPQPVRNKELAAKLGSALHRPAFMPAPAFVIKLLLGEFGETLLNSQRAVPAKLEKFGFQFKYAEMDSALGEIVHRLKS
ncbi:MAG: TIGR01777 family oxidoreductase [Desulfobacterales bacterium]